MDDEQALKASLLKDEAKIRFKTLSGMAKSSGETLKEASAKAAAKVLVHTPNE